VAHDPPKPTPSLDGKYLTFRVGESVYGVRILQVHEIVGPRDIAAAPYAPGGVRRDVHHRGRTIPVVDLRSSFGLPAAPEEPSAVMMIVQCPANAHAHPVAFVVDRILEVLRLRPVQISTGDLGTKAQRAGLVLGIADSGRGRVVLLDPCKLLPA
jgi:purine-binding chemotaxis protein CheW